MGLLKNQYGYCLALKLPFISAKAVGYHQLLQFTLMNQVGLVFLRRCSIIFSQRH
jgi:hypothetical protein